MSEIQQETPLRQDFAGQAGNLKQETRDNKLEIGDRNIEHKNLEHSEEENSNQKREIAEREQESKKTIKQEIKKEKKENIKVKKSGGKVLFFVIILILILVEISGSAYFMMKIPQRALEIQKLRTQNLALQMTAQDEMLLYQDLKETEKDRENLKSVFPDESSLVEFIEIIDEIKKSNIVQVVKFSLNSDVPTKIGKGQNFLPMTLIIKGKESDVIMALNKIIRSKYFIQTIEYSKEFTNEGDQVIVATQFHLFVANDFIKINP